MHLLAAIPHYFRPRAVADGRPHGSTGGDPRPRIDALTAAIAGLHQLFGGPQGSIDLATRRVEPANAATAGAVEILIVTNEADHLVNALPTRSFRHVIVTVPPTELGFAAHRLLAEHGHAADWLAYFEDDVIVRDPWFLAKLAWFHRKAGDLCLLQPNRYEVMADGPIRKAYLDGELPIEVTRPFQDVTRDPILTSEVFGVPLQFVRVTNPHAGCFVVARSQWDRLVASPGFGQPSGKFIGPLESAATLGIMHAFRTYKPARACASFFEVEHAGSAFAAQILLESRPSARPTD